jgi:C1A family cysteine protease
MKKRIVNVLFVVILTVAGLIALSARETGRREPVYQVDHGVYSHPVSEKEIPSGEFKIGPVNDAFLNFSEYSEDAKNRYKKKKGRKDRIFGLIPSPIPPEIHKKTKPGEIKEGSLPGRYDLRDPDGNGDPKDSLLTPVKDQEECRAAWAFAVYGGLEGFMKSREGMPDFFSENHMMFSTGYDWGECGGGNLDMSMAYLSRNKGPVRMASDPLVIGSEHYCTSCAPVHYIDSVFKLPVRSSVSDITYIKKAILDYGPLVASMYWIESEYNPKSHTYCCASPGTNHAVTLVGWDDQKSVHGASKKGAFIAKNSWGNEFGEIGRAHV